MRQKLAAAVVITFSISTVWAGPVRHRGSAATPLQDQTLRSGHQIGSLRFGPRKAVKRSAAGKEATTPPPAPGVVQVQALEGHVFAYFVFTSPMPAGATIGGGVTIMQQGDVTGQFSFDDVQFNAVDAGSFIALPQLSSLGDLWPTGEVYYTVDVTINGRLTEANGQFLVGESLTYDDLRTFAPVISGTSQRIAGNKDMILVINGVFTSDPPLVVLEGTVPPSTAITQVSSTEIDVNLSRVQGLDLTTLNEYLLTVSQGGFADTMLYRYAPSQPGTFNPAPQ
jgi:hypothetical protein